MLIDEEKNNSFGKFNASLSHLQYVPTKQYKIQPMECYKVDKYNQLVDEIQKCEGLTDEQRRFLLFAATRHIQFNYQMVAELYAQSSKEMQVLMERSGLVIVDFNDALENDFIELTEELKFLRQKEIEHKESVKND